MPDRTGQSSRYNRGTPAVQTAPAVRSWGTLAANTTLQLSTADVHLITLGASITLTLDAATVPDRTKVLVYLTQDATGSRTVTWSSVTWLSGITPTLQTGAAAVDEIELTAFNVSGTITWVGRQLGKDLNANTTGNAATVTNAVTAWTPAIDRLTTSPTGVTYSRQLGTYTKVGSVWTISWDLVISAITTAGTGINCITGFPMTPARNRVGAHFASGLTTTTPSFTARVVPGTPKIFFVANDLIGTSINENFAVNGVSTGTIIIEE